MIALIPHALYMDCLATMLVLPHLTRTRLNRMKYLRYASELV